MRFLTYLSRSLLLSTTASALAVAAVAFAPRPAAGDVVFMASGTSRLGKPVAFQALLSIDGDNLEIVLDNLSPKDTTDAADVLTSFYFDIWNGTDRPQLTYERASGYVYQVKKGLGDDEPVYYTPPMPPVPAADKPSNLVAMEKGDASWQFLQIDPEYAPHLGFGIGTVANNALSPNGFAPAVVGPGCKDLINFGIYRLNDPEKGDIAPDGVLDNTYVVQNTATFTFTGVGKYSEKDIQPKAVFGLGTRPDSIVVVPEPGVIVIASGALLAMWRARWRRKAGREPAPPTTG
jgi:hypothetical protein